MTDLKKSITLNEAAKRAAKMFADKNFETPRLDAETLLAEALDVDRAKLFLKMEETLEEETAERFEKFVEKRLSGMPVAYVRGRKEFFSIEFLITPDVPIPRPETEFLVQAVLDAFGRDEEFAIADLCTGSGNVPVAVAANRRYAKIFAADVSTAALEVADTNARRNGALEVITFLSGDLFAPLEENALAGKLDAVVSNPPYVSDGEYESLPAGIKNFEPERAFRAGSDGLDFIRRIIDGAPRFLKPRGLLAMEIGYDQGEAVRNFMERDFEGVEIRKDYSGNDRIAAGRLKVE